MWFRVAFTASGPNVDETGAEAGRRLLIRFVEQMQARFGVGRPRTLIAGFSQGGVMSASVGLSAPDLVAGFAILAGRILPELEPRLAPREQLAILNVLIAHGQYDTRLPVTWAERADRWLDELGVPHRTRLYLAGHEVNQAMRGDFVAWAGTLIEATR